MKYTKLITAIFIFLLIIVFATSNASASNSIEIGSVDDLSKIGNDDSYPLDGTYILTKSIMISDEWLSIGNGDYPFTGIFDGNGNTITLTDVNISRNTGLTKNTDGAGLFGNIKSKSNSPCVIKNLNIIVTNNLSSNNHFGTLVGHSVNSFIENCSVIYLNESYLNGGSAVGGIIGYNDGSVIKNCTVVSNVMANSNYAGGFVGNMINGSIINSTSTGDVSTSNYGTYAGGLIGQATNVYIQNCSAVGNISSSAGGGGLIGRVFMNVTIVNSFTKCNVTTSAEGAGGLIGIQNVFNTSIKDSYATGTIIAKSYGAGGLIGIISDGSIETSYFVGNVLASNKKMGGLVGTTNNDLKIISSFYSDNIDESSPFGTAVPNSEMKQISTYLNDGKWNISTIPLDSIWYIVEGEDYPQLSWSYKPHVVEPVIENVSEDSSITEVLPITDVPDSEEMKNNFMLYVYFGIFLLVFVILLIALYFIIKNKSKII